MKRDPWTPPPSWYEPEADDYCPFRCKHCEKVFRNEEPFYEAEYPDCEYDDEDRMMVGEIFCSRDCHKAWFEENFYGDYDDE